MFWQYLVIVIQISIGTGQLLSDNGSFNNPFASIEPSTSLIWTSCNDTTASSSPTEAGSNSNFDYECARLLVPFEYSSNEKSNATDSQFSIAILRLPATDPENYKGPIFFNFGGPGNPGTLTLREYAPLLRDGAFAETMSGYDLVSFDPRGIGNTLPAVSCFTSREDSLAFSRSLGNSVIGQSNESFIISDAQYRLLSDSCVDNAADLIPFIGTVYVVEDLRWMVEAYGYSDKLSFIGLSYGSLLGMTYAATYPDKVERLVLDGIVDPVNAYTEIATPEIFADDEAILRYFFRTCFEAGPSRCPFWFDGPEAIAEAYDQVNERLRHLPFIANDENGKRRLIEWHDLQDPVLQALYDPDAVFLQLAQDLAAIYNNKSNDLSTTIGNPLPSSFDLFLVDPDTKKPNGEENTFLIRCADTPEWLLGEDLSFDEWQEYILGEEVTQYGRFASLRTEGFYGPCSRLSINPSKRFEGRFSADNPINTSAPILFLSMRLDPATPLSAAFSASSIFTNSAVVVNDDVGHVATTAINECLGQVIGQYLVLGILPENGTVCEPGPGEGGEELLFPAEGEGAERLQPNRLGIGRM